MVRGAAMVRARAGVIGYLALLSAIMPGLMSGALAQSFTAPVQLSQHGYAGSPMVAIDDTGTALAVWADEGAFFSVHAPGMAWTAPQSVYIEGGSGLTLQATPGGFATIASYETGYGIYTIDRPAGGAWTAPVTAVSGPDIVTPNRTGAPGMIFAANPTGAQVIVWEQDNGGSFAIMAVHRPAGGGWGSPETVVLPPTGLYIALADATIGPQGDALVAWETYSVSCGVHSCGEGNFTVHASREPAGSGIWTDSGPVTPGIATNGWVVRALIDPAGQSGLLLQAGQFPSALQVVHQRSAGAKWSAVEAAFTDVSGGYPTLWGASTGGKSHASFASVDYGSPLRILTGDGSLATGKWAAPSDLSASDSTGPNELLSFGANEAGGLAVTWVDADDTVRAAVRKRGFGAVPAATTVAVSDGCQMTVLIAPCRAPGVTAINGAGAAVTLFREGNLTATNFTLYAATTN
jgi:hypothetical protein